MAIAAGRTVDSVAPLSWQGQKCFKSTLIVSDLPGGVSGNTVEQIHLDKVLWIPLKNCSHNLSEITLLYRVLQVEHSTLIRTLCLPFACYFVRQGKKRDNPTCRGESVDVDAAGREGKDGGGANFFPSHNLKSRLWSWHTNYPIASPRGKSVKKADVFFGISLI